jgi:hypothetical protein
MVEFIEGVELVIHVYYVVYQANIWKVKVNNVQNFIVDGIFKLLQLAEIDHENSDVIDRSPLVSLHC